MPKAVLRFSLPEEREEFEQAYKAGKYHSALYEYGEWLRKKIKYEEHPKEFKDAIAMARQHFYDVLTEQGIDL